MRCQLSRPAIVKLGSCTRAEAYRVGLTRRPRSLFYLIFERSFNLSIKLWWWWWWWRRRSYSLWSIECRWPWVTLKVISARPTENFSTVNISRNTGRVTYNGLQSDLWLKMKNRRTKALSCYSHFVGFYTLLYYVTIGYVGYVTIGKGRRLQSLPIWAFTNFSGNHKNSGRRSLLFPC